MKHIRNFAAILGVTSIALLCCGGINVAAEEKTEPVSVPTLVVEETTNTAEIIEIYDIEETETEIIEEDPVAKANAIKLTSTMEKKYVSTTHVKNFGYWIYKPNYSTDEELPLIVYMHGIGERGSNLDQMLNVSLPMYLYNKDVAVNAIVIMPQCPSSTNWTNLADDVMELINIVKAEENIDDTSISLTGHSLGGIGTWKIALKYPEVFASLVPVSSTINTPNECTKLTETAIWSFHGSRDTMTPTSMLQAQKVIESAGGTKMQVTMFEGQGHCITGLVYNNPEYDVLNWMASQHRSEN